MNIKLTTTKNNNKNSHNNETYGSSRLAFVGFVAALIAAFSLLLTIAPAADAQRGGNTDDSDILAATSGCPSGFVEGRFGCVPGSYQIDKVELAPTSPCPDGWVVASVPGGCQPGSVTAKTPNVGVLDLGCPDGWVVASVPGGCQPGSVTAKTPTTGVLDLGCPDGWVVASVPGGCLPGSYTSDRGVDIYAISHVCAFDDDICDVMVEAVLALGGHCVHDHTGDYCELPDFPEPRP